MVLGDTERAYRTGDLDRMLFGGHHCDRRELRFGSTASFNSSFARLVTASAVSSSANFLRAATSSALSLVVIPGTRVKRCRPS
jgi:hypothetical protein